MRKTIQGKLKGLVPNQFKKPVIPMAKEIETKETESVKEKAEEAEAETTETKTAE